MSEFIPFEEFAFGGRRAAKAERRGDGAPVHRWLAEPLPADVARSVERLARCGDVVHVALMPDAHLSENVCVGTVMATERLVYPAAIGGDIGCGMAAVAFDGPAGVVDGESAARALLARLREAVPANRQREAAELPAELMGAALSDPALERVRRRDGRVQFGTLGGGNHFLEFQVDDDDVVADARTAAGGRGIAGRLWLMLHTGSRGVGQAIRDSHLRRASGRHLAALDVESDAGRAYLADMAWAEAYAAASRRAIVDAACGVVRELFGLAPLPGSFIDCHHNFIRREVHFGREVYVHRKGAIPADEGEMGITPGSMGTESYHVCGRGCAAALRSSAHGAGRAMSRVEARRRVSVGRLAREMEGVWFDAGMAEALREEGPGAYKDVGRVMRAQRELTRVVRRLRPVVSYKGR